MRLVMRTFKHKMGEQQEIEFTEKKKRKKTNNNWAELIGLDYEERGDREKNAHKMKLLNVTAGSVFDIATVSSPSTVFVYSFT